MGYRRFALKIGLPQTPLHAPLEVPLLCTGYQGGNPTAQCKGHSFSWAFYWEQRALRLIRCLNGEAAFPADEVAGSQVRVNFSPITDDFAELLATLVNQMTTFIPISWRAAEFFSDRQAAPFASSSASVAVVAFPEM